MTIPRYKTVTLIGGPGAGLRFSVDVDRTRFVEIPVHQPVSIEPFPPQAPCKADMATVHRYVIEMPLHGLYVGMHESLSSLNWQDRMAAMMQVLLDSYCEHQYGKADREERAKRDEFMRGLNFGLRSMMYVQAERERPGVN